MGYATFHFNIVSVLVPIPLQKQFLSTFSLSPSFKIIVMDCLSNQCFTYSSVLENYSEAPNDKLSDFMRCTYAVMKKILMKLPVSISRRNKCQSSSTYTLNSLRDNLAIKL